MIYCPNCNKELEDGAKFCGECGAAVYQPEKVDEELPAAENQAVFEPSSGETEVLLNQPPIYQPEQYPVSDYQAQAFEKPAAQTGKKANPLNKLKGKISKKAFIFGGAGVIVLAAVILIISLIAGSGSSAPEYALYIKDKELVYSGLSGDPFQVTGGLFDTDIDNEEIFEGGSFFVEYCQLKADGKILFYPDRINQDDDGGTIYYRYVDKPKKEPVKIDSEISIYSVNDAGDTMYYIKGDSDNLYRYDVKKGEKEKITEDVYSYRISDDFDTLYYLTFDDDLYMYNGNEPEKIDSEIENYYTSESFETVIYIKEDALYMKKTGAEKVKVASDVDSILAYYDETGEIYYTKENAEKNALINYITDDLKEKDSAMAEPQPPQYPSYFDYDSQEEYDKAYDEYEKAYDDYLEKKEEYWDKEYRDELRAQLEEETTYSTIYSLYYYNGKEEKLLSENCLSYDERMARDAAVISYNALDSENMEKVKLSEADSIYELKTAVSEAMSNSATRYIAVKDAVGTIKQKESIKSIVLSFDGKTAYFVDEVPEDEFEGNLYKVDISDSKVGEPELYDSDVYYNGFGFLENGDIAYFKDYSASEGDLYIEKELVDYAVYIGSIRFCESSGAVVYFTDWDDYCGTLKIYSGKKAEKIGDDATGFVLLEDGKILYITNFSDSSYKGELYLYKKNKSEKVDDDVCCLIPPEDAVYFLYSAYY